MSLCGFEIDLCGASHLSNEMYSPKKEELGNTSSSLHALVISIPRFFTYVLYIVIAFVLEVFYIPITLLLVWLTLSCWCTYVSLVYLGCWLVNLNT